MKIEKTIPFYADTSELAEAFLEGRVAVEFGNTSGLGVENDWCEIRTEPSVIALAYHEFETAEDAEEFCKQFGTKTNVTGEAHARWKYLMGGAA